MGGADTERTAAEGGVLVGSGRLGWVSIRCTVRRLGSGVRRRTTASCRAGRKGRDRTCTDDGRCSRTHGRSVPVQGLLLCLYLLTTPSLVAGDLESWSDVDVRILDTDPVEVTVGGVARIRESLRSLYDRRATAKLAVALSDDVDLRLDYILREQVLPEFGFGSDHRLVAGLRYPILQRALTVVGTTLYERHFGRPDILDFNRYRQQVDMERPSAPISPWFHQSLAFRREGFVRTRSRLGFRWRFASGHALKGAYQFESFASGAAWRPRHAIVTEWRYDLVTGERRSR